MKIIRKSTVFYILFVQLAFPASARLCSRDYCDKERAALSFEQKREYAKKRSEEVDDAAWNGTPNAFLEDEHGVCGCTFPYDPIFRCSASFCESDEVIQRAAEHYANLPDVSFLALNPLGYDCACDARHWAKNGIVVPQKAPIISPSEGGTSLDDLQSAPAVGRRK